MSLSKDMNMSEEKCVLCDAKVESKELLKEHFRKHANKEIDNKGRPISKASSPSGKPLQKKCLVSILHHSGNEKRQPNVSEDKQLKGLVQPPSGQNDSPRNKQDTSSAMTAHRVHALHLSKDKRLHTITCDVCAMSFTSAASAMAHKWRMHPNQPSKFCCSHCGKQFPLKTFLENHLVKEHFNSNPQKVLKCEECGVDFYNESARDYHSKVAHKRLVSVLTPVATPPPSKKIRLTNAGDAESVYYCHLCGIEYIIKFNLRKHLQSRHANEDTSVGPDTEIIRCITCEAIFCNKKAYEAHNMYHRPDDLYVTSEEHRRKTVSRVDQDFDLRRVQIQAPKTVQGFAKQKMKMLWFDQSSRLGPSTIPSSSTQLQKSGCSKNPQFPQDMSSEEMMRILGSNQFCRDKEIKMSKKLLQQRKRKSELVSQSLCVKAEQMKIESGNSVNQVKHSEFSGIARTEDRPCTRLSLRMESLPSSSDSS